MVLSSTGADEPIIDKAIVLTAMKRRKNRPLFFIDIAVPRDIEPAVNDIENVYLYDIDDLKGLAQAHLSEQDARIARRPTPSWTKRLTSSAYGSNSSK